MIKFVWLDVDGGGKVPVNPDQVAYLRRDPQAAKGHTKVVFGAVQGGLHELEVLGDAEAVAKQLEGRPAAARTPSKHARQRA